MNYPCEHILLETSHNYPLKFLQFHPSEFIPTLISSDNVDKICIWRMLHSINEWKLEKTITISQISSISWLVPTQSIIPFNRENFTGKIYNYYLLFIVYIFLFLFNFYFIYLLFIYLFLFYFYFYFYSLFIIYCYYALYCFLFIIYYFYALI